MKYFRDYIKQLREQRGMTFADFAKEYGISKRTAIRYENTDYLDNPSPLITSKVCKTFNIDVDTLTDYNFKPDTKYIEKVIKYLSDDFQSIHSSSIEYFKDNYLCKNGFNMNSFKIFSIWMKYEYPMNQTDIIGTCKTSEGNECSIYYLPPRTSNDLMLYPRLYDFSQFEHFPDFVKIFLTLIKENSNISNNCFIITPSKELYFDIKRNYLFKYNGDFHRNITLVYSNSKEKIETTVLTGKQIK